MIHSKHNDYIHNLVSNTTVIHSKQHDYIHNLSVIWQISTMINMIFPQLVSNITVIHIK